jgi:hypothetical protein
MQFVCLFVCLNLFGCRSDHSSPACKEQGSQRFFCDYELHKQEEQFLCRGRFDVKESNNFIILILFHSHSISFSFYFILILFLLLLLFSSNNNFLRNARIRRSDSTRCRGTGPGRHCCSTRDLRATPCCSRVSFCKHN